MRIDRVLWAGVAVPPLAWAAHLLIAYALVSLECSKHLPLAGLTHALTLLALTATLAALAASAWAWRETAPDPVNGRGLARADRRRSMALLGIAAGALFATGIAYGEIGATVLRACS